MSAIELIQAERSKQIAKGFDPAHDDSHDEGEIALAAAFILSEHTDGPGCVDEEDDDLTWMNKLAVKSRDWQPVDRLVVAAALLVAEIERLQREGHVE